MPAGATAAMPLLENLGRAIAAREPRGLRRLPSRLRHGARRRLARVRSTRTSAREDGDLQRAARRRCWSRSPQLARRYGVPCQVSLEEFMACGVGGCAGCTVLVQTPDGPAMKRVCVDGPVFDAATVFSALARALRRRDPRSLRRTVARSGSRNARRADASTRGSAGRVPSERLSAERARVPPACARGATGQPKLILRFEVRARVGVGQRFFDVDAALPCRGRSSAESKLCMPRSFAVHASLP